MKHGSSNGMLGMLAMLVMGGTALAAGLPMLNAQQSGGGLKRVQTQDDQRTEVDPWKAEEWRRDLTVSDLEQREKNFERLVQAARRDPAGRARLEEWSRDTDTEFAWSARLALRELDHRGLFPSFDPDAFGSVFQGHALPEGSFSFSFPQDFQFPQAFDLDLFNGMQGQSGGVQSEKSCISLSITPDGVKATVTTEENGTETKQEYQAESLDALLEAHPELRDKIGVGHGAFGAFGMGGLHTGGMGGNVHLFTPGTPFEFDFGTGLGGGLQLEPGQFQLRLGQPRTDVLGVYVEPTADAQSRLDTTLPADGMWIQKVEPGTIAAELGLKPGQTLTHIDGRAIRSRDDISAAMRDRAQDATIEVEIVEPDGARRTLRWDPPKDTGVSGVPGLRKI